MIESQTMHQIIPQCPIKAEIKNTLSLSIPLIASQLVFAFSNFIGTAMVAHLGKDALAASVLVSMIWISLSVMFFGILNSVSTLVSHQYGARNHKAISMIMGQSYILGIAITIIMVLFLQCMPLFLHWSSQPPNVIILSTQYLHAMLWQIPGLIAWIVFDQFLAGIGKTRLVLRLSLLIVPIEIPFIYLLVFGKWGLPNCGIAGVGYGFAISYTISAIGLVWYLYCTPHYQKYKIFSECHHINWDYLKELIYIGLPMGFMNFIEVSTFGITTFWIGQFGTTALAAHQIVIQYLSFFITLVFGMSQAVSIRVGHCIGAKDFANVPYAAYVGMALNTLCILFIAIGFIWMPELFMRFDINIHDPANNLLIQNTSALLAICGALIIFDNFRIIGFGALRGLKDTKFPMYASFVSFWGIGLTSAYLFSFIFHFNDEGVWWGLTLGIASGAIIVLARLKYKLAQSTV